MVDDWMLKMQENHYKNKTEFGASVWICRKSASACGELPLANNKKPTLSHRVI